VTQNVKVPANTFCKAAGEDIRAEGSWTRRVKGLAPRIAEKLTHT